MTHEYEFIGATEHTEVLNRISDTEATEIQHDKTVLDLRARIALDLLRSPGVLVSAVDGGEDTAGRANKKLMPPDELVMRVCDIAELAVMEFQNRSWTIKV